MYSSWATSWSGNIRLREHQILLSGFNTILDAAIRVNADWVLETVVDKIDFWGINKGAISPVIKTRSFRLWVPLTKTGAVAFASVLAARLSGINTSEEDNDEHTEKRRRVSSSNAPPSSISPITSIDAFLAMLRLYYGGKRQIEDVTFDIDEDGDIRDDNILQLLAAHTYFCDAGVSARHSQQRLCDEQSDLGFYVNGETNDFAPADMISDAGLARHMTVGRGGILKSWKDLFGFLLPHYVPSKRMLLNKVRAVVDATGGVFDAHMENSDIDEIVHLGQRAAKGNLFSDPIAYSPIEADFLDLFITEHNDGRDINAQLLEAYPVSTRLYATNTTRINAAAQSCAVGEPRLVFEGIVREIDTLLTTQLDGVPSVYSELGRESSEGIHSIRKGTSCQHVMARRMFFRRRPDDTKYTGFGFKMLSVLIGANNCLRLMEQQVSLFMLLYGHHFSCTANRVGASGLVIVCGPPDTGKSRACEQWLECCAESLRVLSDGSSAKSYTAGTTRSDLRCVYQDEIKDLLAPTMGSASGASDEASNSALKTRQTLLSRGWVRYSRLIQDPHTNDYQNHDILVMQRQMTVGCTNAVNAIPPAVQSRASVVPVVKEERNVTREVSVNMLVASRENQAASALETAFKTNLRMVSALQGRYWQLELFGVISPANDNIFVLFQALFEQNHGSDALPPRRCLDIKRLSEALMVFDLVTLWHARGLGAKFGFDPVTEAMFYQSRSVIRMEHICSALYMLTNSTSMHVHVSEVSMIIKSLIKLEGGLPMKSDDGDYFVLKSNRKSLSGDILHQAPQMGLGLVQQCLMHVSRSVTFGLPNIRYEAGSNGQEMVCVNCKYMAAVLTPVERTILALLKGFIDRAESVYTSFDEKAYVFTSKIRTSIYNHHDNESHLQYEDLQRVADTQVKNALTMLEYRTSRDGVTQWSTPQFAEVALPASETALNAVPYETRSGKKTSKTLIAPLVVSKTVFTNLKAVASSPYDGTFTKALAIAGGYTHDSRVFLGPAPAVVANAVDHFVVTTHEPVTVRLRNPFYVSSGEIGLQAMMGDTSDVPNDTLWPRDCKVIEFTETSNVEETLVKMRHRATFGADCPEAFLPRSTNYL